MPCITEHFGIPGPVPFLDVEVTTDNRLFIDPHAIRLRTEPEPFITQANSCTTSFFNSVALCATAPAGSLDRISGQALLQRFGEPRETRLGLAEAGFNGHGGADGIGSSIWHAFTHDLRALVDVAVLGHIEDIPLFVEGVDRDITSDLTTRIIFGPLADFTAEMMNHYPQFRATDKAVNVSRQVWDPLGAKWRFRDLELPAVAGRPLVLVPRGWARPRLLMSAGRYYETSVLSYAQLERAVVIKERLIKTPKDRLRWQKDLVRGRMTNLSVTLRAQTKADNLVAGFTDFVDDRYYSGSEGSQAA
jgi:hypothetical protein